MVDTSPHLFNLCFLPETPLQIYNNFVPNPSAPECASSPPLGNASSSGPYTRKVADGQHTGEGVCRTLKGPLQEAPRGNKYTPSLYGGLASRLSTVESVDIKGKQIAMLPFSSGCTASHWGVIVKGNTTEITTKLDLLNRLASIKIVQCEEFVDACSFRASALGAPPLTPF